MENKNFEERILKNKGRKGKYRSEKEGFLMLIWKY